MSAQLIRYALIGVVSSAVFVLLYVLFRGVVGPQLSNALALTIAAVASTTAHRRLTFGIRGRRHVTRNQIEGLAVFAVGWGFTAASLAVLDHLDPAVGRTTELAVLVVASALATVLRFIAYRWWVFHPRRDATASRVSAHRSL